MERLSRSIVDCHILLDCPDLVYVNLAIWIMGWPKMNSTSMFSVLWTAHTSIVITILLQTVVKEQDLAATSAKKDNQDLCV